MITWPDFTFPPINLWNAPRQYFLEENTSIPDQAPANPRRNRPTTPDRFSHLYQLRHAA
jgi:hypothetical protein